MLFEPQLRKWRWIAFLATVLNLAFNALAPHLPLGKGSILEITQRHPTLFSPAPYAFSIWGLIYLTTLAYAIYQLRPGQRHVDAYDRMAKPLAALNALATAWIVVFQNDLIAWSVAVIFASLFFAWMFLVHANRAADRQEIDRWILLPATLWFAWLSVAAIANVSLFVGDLGWSDGNQVSWALAAIGIAVASGFLIGSRFHSWVYPLVMAWAAASVWMERKSDSRLVAMFALLACAMMLAWSAYCAMRTRRAKRGFRIFRGPIDAR